MIQQISYYISKAGIAAAAGKTEDERRRLSDMPKPAAFVSYAPGLPALVGWYGYRVAFNGVGRVQLEAALASLRRHFRLRDLREWYDRYSGFYIVEALFAVRMNLPGGVFGGAQPAPDITDYLNFTMPDGGKITLTRNNTPTVVELEYSLDDRHTWADWEEVGNERTLTLTAGQKMWLRNKSATQTGFSTSTIDFYQFAFTDTVYASGNINSLLCKYPNVVTVLSAYCYLSLFFYCSSLVTAPELNATTLSSFSCRSMFNSCTSLQYIKTLMTDISATDCIRYWLYNASPTGDFYCDQNLTIPTGTDGIPSGWTRHDL